MRRDPGPGPGLRARVPFDLLWMEVALNAETSRDSPRVAFDVGATKRRRVTGWERFVLSLESALRVSTNSPGVEVVSVGPKAVRTSSALFLVRQLAWHFAGLKTAANGFDVLHAPTFPPPALDVPTVWTVHDDLILGGHPEYARRGARIWVPLARRALTRPIELVATTQAVRDDLLRVGVPPTRLSVIRPGVPDLPAATEEPPRLTGLDGVSRPIPAIFLLVVGTLEHRKRPDTAALAAAELDLPIVFVGGTDPRFRFPALRKPQLVYLAGRATDPELRWLYENALALIAPSAYEGFDFPISEALTLGVHVAASDIPVHREVLGPDAHLFSTGDVSGACEVISAVVSVPNRMPQAPRCWASCAREYAALYRRLAATAGA
jgi:glycosyltransferase involved in cell wall biosynthesis